MRRSLQNTLLICAILLFGAAPSMAKENTQSECQDEQITCSFQGRLRGSITIVQGSKLGPELEELLQENQDLLEMLLKGRKEADAIKVQIVLELIVDESGAIETIPTLHEGLSISAAIDVANVISELKLGSAKLKGATVLELWLLPEVKERFF